MDDEVPIPWWGKLFYLENRDEITFEDNGRSNLEGNHWWISSIEEQVKVCSSKGRKKNDALALKTILSGLSSPIKESMGQCTSAKDLWINIEETYQSKKEKVDIEDHSIKIINGKESPKTLDCIISKCDLENISSEDSTKEDPKSISNEDLESPKTLDCNNSKCDDVEFFSTSEEENLEVVWIKSIDCYPMEEVEEKLLELKKKVEDGLYEYSNDHYYIDYGYLSDNTKKFLKKSQKNILKLKEMLKELEESSKTQLEEKEEEITRLKNEKEDMKVDDEISKILETIVHLKTQIEEPKRIEELLKNQINEKGVML
jgi:hypothetical protein